MIRSRSACDSRVLPSCSCSVAFSPASSYFSSVNPPADVIVLPRLRLKIFGPSAT